jgi:hypothetical protein
LVIVEEGVRISVARGSVILSLYIITMKSDGGPSLDQQPDAF